jgi:hypothetical protein
MVYELYRVKEEEILIYLGDRVLLKAPRSKKWMAAVQLCLNHSLGIDP